MLSKEHGGLLCDEMGLGKTIEILGLIANSTLKNNLLVAPIAVLNQWKDIAIKSHINVMMFNTSWKLSNKPFINRPFLYIIGYETLSRNISTIKNIIFDRLICDEAHRLGVKDIKKHIHNGNPITKVVYNTINQIQSSSKWFLTATPIVNSTDDLLSLFALMGINIETTPLELAMEEHSLSRSMEQLRFTMPEAPKKAIIITHKLKFRSEKEEDFYISIQSSVERQLRYGAVGAQGLRLISILRQVSIHPQIYIHSKQKKNTKGIYPFWSEPSTKFLKIKELLNFEKQKEHKWIIFCQFHEEMNLLKEYLSPLPYIRNIETYSGDMNQEQKTESLDAIRAPFDPLDSSSTCDVLLLQLKSGGVGLNLQEFDRIVFCSPWWTQASIDQGIGRAVRIGQKKQVVVHHLMLQQEETMLENNQAIKNIDMQMKEKAEEKELLNQTFLNLADRNTK